MLHFLVSPFFLNWNCPFLLISNILDFFFTSFLVEVFGWILCKIFLQLMFRTWLSHFFLFWTFEINSLKTGYKMVICCAISLKKGCINVFIHVPVSIFLSISSIWISSGKTLACFLKFVEPNSMGLFTKNFDRKFLILVG
jgi:hypothetical protein